MERSKSSGFTKLVSRQGSAKRSNLRSDEVLVDVGLLEPAAESSSNWAIDHPKVDANDKLEEAHAMLELSFDVHGDHVTLRSVNPGAIAEVPNVAGEEQMWERTNSSDRRRRGRNSVSAMVASAASESHNSRSTSFRESIKAVGNMVQQLSSNLTRNSRNGRRQDMAGNPLFEPKPLIMDPELGDPRHMQKSASRAEYAIKGLQMISKATATADQKKSWAQVEARFHKLATPDNLLTRSNFAECIGT